MRVLVTGGAGFIGSHITRAYLEAGHEVTVLDNLSSGHRENVPDGARFEKLDVRSAEAAELIRSLRPEALNHHAAQMNVRVSVDDPRFDADVNILGFINLLEAGRQSGLKKVVFASSGGTVYGEPDQLPCTERHALQPVCPYGVSKLTGENYLYYYHKIFGLSYVALRYSNVYGPLQDPHGEAGVVAIFCQQLLAGRDCTIFGDGLQTRDYVFVADVARASVAAVASDFCGSVNIGTGTETSVNDLFEQIKLRIGDEGKALHGPAKDGEVRRSVLDVAHARTTLGWSPKVGLADGLAQTVDFFRSRS